MLTYADACSLLQGGQEMLIVMEFMDRGSLSDVLMDKTIALSGASLY
jgi:hypothetical protein